MAAFAIAPSYAAEPRPADRPKDSPGESLLDFLTSAGIRSTRVKAETLKTSLPSYEGAVEVPSAERLYGWIRGLCATPHRRPGTPEGHRAEAWVAQRLEELGLEQVTRDRIPITVWRAGECSLSIEGTKIPCSSMLRAGFTPSGGVTAPMVYVGEGGLGQFAGKKPRGKIVVAELAMSPSRSDANPSRVYFTSDPEGHLASAREPLALPWNLPGESVKVRLLDVYTQAQLAGAVGIVIILRDYPSAGDSLHWPYGNWVRSLPGVYVGKRHGSVLREWAKMGKTTTVVLRGSTELGWTSNVWGVLPGVSDEVVLVTSHHDSPYRGAVENGCGMAQLLGQAWAWGRVPRERRPRTLVFLASAGHTLGDVGALEFARGHGELMRRVRACFSLERIGAKEVREGSDGSYEPTGSPQPSVLYVPAQADIVGSVLKAIEAHPFPATVARAPELDLPWTNASELVRWVSSPDAGYPRRGGLPYAAWTSAPLYLLDREDTLDKVDRDRLEPLAATVTEIVKGFLVLDGARR